MRAAVIAVAIWLSTMGPCFAQTPVAATTRIETRIPPQLLSSALKEFARLRHVQVLFLTDIVKHLKTQGASGDLTADDTLALLLTGTGLTYRYVDHNAVSIVPGRLGKFGLRKTSGTGADLGRSRQDKEADPARRNEDPPTAPIPRKRAPGPTYATEALQEIVVTAQKYKQRAFDVPINLDVVTGEEIEQRQITTVTDLQYDVPGLVVEGGDNAHRIYLQGVGNFAGNGSLVGEYIDEADVTALASSGQTGVGSTESSLYDLSRVEVLRGPQGTLYGDGSMGGVIRYITNKPDLESTLMSADVAAGLTENGAPSQRLVTVVNAPIMEGTLGLRVAGLIENDGGWIDMPAANLKNINSGDLVDLRMQALWQPSTALNISGTQIVHRDSFGIGYDEDASGNIPEVFGVGTPPHSEVSFNLTNLTATLELPDVKCLSSATYFNTGEDEHDMFDIGEESPQFGSFSFWDLTAYDFFATKDFSDELRFSDTHKGAWHWTVGGFYKQFRDAQVSQGYFGAPGPLSAATLIPGNFGDYSRSWAAFADVSYQLFNRLTLGAGVRNFRDYESTVSLGVPLQEATFTSTDPRYYVQYRVSPHISSYASAAKGFRSGGFNSPGLPPYGPETLWSYTVGTKLRYLDDRLLADVALFDSSYSNYVVVGYFPQLAQFASANAGTARIRGGDADFAWRPNGLWRFGLNAELLHTKFVTVNGADTGFSVGDRLPFAPTYSFTLSMERDFRLHERPGYVELYYYEISRTQYITYGFNPGESEIPHFLNLRTGLQWNDDLQLGFLFTNLVNDRGSLSPLATVSGESMRPQPRTIWVQFGVKLAANQ
jgi:iron complex outermembrane recepter protein